MVIENKEIDKDTEEEEQQLCFRGRGIKNGKVTKREVFHLHRFYIFILYFEGCQEMYII